MKQTVPPVGKPSRDLYIQADIALLIPIKVQQDTEIWTL